MKLLKRGGLIFPLLLLLTPVSPLHASSSASGSADLVHFFAILALMLVVGKVSGEAFERLGQPAVLGELIAGILLGPSMLGVIPVGGEDVLQEVITVFAEIGVVVLLFEIGLETDIKQMFRVGPAASSIALVGVALPFVLGAGYWLSPLVDSSFNVADSTTTAIFIGATLTATSVGITARVLKDLNAMRSLESQLIIGAAVIDDILGLVILGIVATLVTGASVTFLGVGRALVVAIGFLVVSVAVGRVVAPKLFGIVDKLRVRGVLLVAAFAFLLAFSALAQAAGSAMIIGAFAAGIVLSETNQFDQIEERIKPVADIFTPVFFLSVGAAFDVNLLNPFGPNGSLTLTTGIALTLLAVIGKLAAGWAAPWSQYNRSAVGVGMIPRGEVGLIFANLGLSSQVLNDQLFGAVIITVIATTLIAPPLLKWRLRDGYTEPPSG